MINLETPRKLHLIFFFGIICLFVSMFIGAYHRQSQIDMIESQIAKINTRIDNMPEIVFCDEGVRLNDVPNVDVDNN